MLPAKQPPSLPQVTLECAQNGPRALKQHTVNSTHADHRGSLRNGQGPAFWLLGHL